MGLLYLYLYKGLNQTPVSLSVVHLSITNGIQNTLPDDTVVACLTVPHFIVEALNPLILFVAGTVINNI
jgi:hypothetical protein